MSTKYAVGLSPLTNIIYAGRPNKKGNRWLQKEDVTDLAVEAVAFHVIREGGELFLTDAEGTPLVRVFAEDLRKKEVQP